MHLAIAKPFGLLLLAGALVCPRGASADDMDQGEARITARSDVTMAVESGVRTTSMKLSAIAKHLGSPLGQIKRCYSQVVEEDPGVAGHIDATLTLPAKGPFEVALDGDAVGHRRLKGCVAHALAKISLDDALRPAQALVRLEFTNTAAEAASDVQARRQEMAQVEVHETEDGQLFSEDGTANGKVRFRVVGPDEKAIRAAHHGLERALPRLLDCRRRAGKRASPAGEVVFGLRIQKNGRAQVDVKSSSVAHPNAAPCSRTALRRARYDAGPARAGVTVRFSE